jgi:hypothetical protein
MADKEYIERGALIAEYDRNHVGAPGGARKLMVDAPAADVVEVRHGEWIESTHWGGWYYDCPFCDDGFATRGRHETLPNFCSNCGAKLTGAKMDGERKEQT